MDIQSFANFLTGWPLIIVAVSISALCTILFGFIQIRHFVEAWRLFFAPSESASSKDAAMSPFQALLNALNSNLGNGTVAGVATALAFGGPGAAVWLLIIGFLLMSVRFAEAFLSMYFGARAPMGTKVGGPMLYLAHVPGGTYLPYIYAACCFLYGLVGANGFQTNSISLSIQTAFGTSSYIIGACILAFVIYTVVGGAQRILRISEKIVPLKIGLFIAATIIILIYHYAAIIPSLGLMFTSAFSYTALAGGIVGYTVIQAMRMGIAKIVMASEAGLGTSAIIFGGTKSKDPVRDAIMSMLSTFITTAIGFTLALCIVMSGTWNNGLKSTALTMSAYSTVFGTVGDWIVIFLSISFGIGAIVAYAYVARQTWIFLTKGSFVWLFSIIYCAVAFAGCIIDPSFANSAVDLLTAIVLFINLYGIVFLLPTILRSLKEYRNRLSTGK